MWIINREACRGIVGKNIEANPFKAQMKKGRFRRADGLPRQIQFSSVQATILFKGKTTATKKKTFPVYCTDLYRVKREIVEDEAWKAI